MENDRDEKEDQNPETEIVQSNNKKEHLEDTVEPESHVKQINNDEMPAEKDGDEKENQNPETKV